MQQLTGIQNLYLQLESAAMPMHASSLTIYDRTTAPGGNVDFPAIQRFIAERASRLPLFRRRLVTIPLSLARPYWVEDPGFDIEFHLRHIALPKPGDWEQLCTQVARLHARPLDRNRPLWECYVIEELDNIPGLPPGSFAFFAKAHCAALGETLSAQLFSALHELAPDSRASPPKVARFFDRNPTFIDLATRTAADALKTPWSVARLLLRQAGPLLATGAQETIAAARGIWPGAHPSAVAAGAAAPRTRFNGQVTPQRVVEGVRFDLPEVERVRERVEGATVNDVAIAVVAGALRRYLDARFEAPAADLVAEAPIASRSATQVFGVRTFVDSAIVPLHADVEDPLERLRRIVAETSRRKARQSARPPRRLALEAVELVPALVVGVAGDLAQRARLGSRVAPIVNTTISSIRGPDVPLYLAGAKLVGYYGFSVVHDLAGLAHVVGYCGGAMTIGVAACRNMLPDPARYAQFLRDAYAELRAATGIAEHGARAGGPRRRAMHAAGDDAPADLHVAGRDGHGRGERMRATGHRLQRHATPRRA